MFLIVAGTLCLILAATGAAGDDATFRPEPFHPVMPLHSLMVEQDRHFGRIVTLIRTTDEEDRLAKLRHEALALAEMANINGYHRGALRHEDYRRWAKQVKVLATELAEHAQQNQTDGFMDTAKQINATCKSCHDKYQ